MNLQTLSRKAYQWRVRLVIGGGIAALFVLPLTGFSQSPNIYTMFSPAMKRQLQAATNPGFTPAQVALLNQHQALEQAIFKQQERNENKQGLRRFHGTLPRGFLRAQKVELQLLFQFELAQRQSSPFGPSNLAFSPLLTEEEEPDFPLPPRGKRRGR